MKAEYRRLGDFIRQVDVRNKEQKVSRLVGLTIDKAFIPSVANTIGTDISNYKIIRKKQFACSLMQVSRDGKMPVAMFEEKEAIMSPAYPMFEVHSSNLLPDYLMLWFLRPEFDREASFYAVGGVRGSLEWNDFCDMMLPVPPIEEQRRIVEQYQTVERRIKNNERLIALLEETAQTIFRHRFVENIDPNNLPEGWRMGILSDIAYYCTDRIDTAELNDSTYISTENMIKDRGGIKNAESVPSGKCIRFRSEDILISNIRPYFKKIWRSTFDGGCSADVLCIRTKSEFYPEYTYSIVERGNFFDYVTAGSKGTKMPRGDREWNMKYEIPIPETIVMDKYHKDVKALRDFIANLRKEIVLLIALKETLTNKL